MIAHLLAEHSGIDLGVARQEGRTEAGTEGGFGFFAEAALRAGHLGGVAVEEVEHGLVRGEAGKWRQDAEGIAGEENDIVGILTLLAVLCTYGFFNGAGLGFAFGGWRACMKFALIGLAANAVGILAGYFTSSAITSMLPLNYNQTAYIITWSIMGALSGGILGWFFGKEKRPEPGTTMRAGNI